MRQFLVPVLGVLAVGAASLGEAPEAEEVEIKLGEWTAWLDSPGGRLPFGLELSRGDDQGLKATIINAEERIEVPAVHEDGRDVVLSFDHYDSRIEARAGEDGASLAGEWTKTGRDGEITKLGFHAQSGLSRWRPTNQFLDRRYSVYFTESGLAVAQFRYFDNGLVHGTFLTPTGDYRYLGGFTDGLERLTLACFDGAHAFLFKSVTARSSTYDLDGNFWSRDTWHEKWRARADPKATLPSAFDETKIVNQSPDLSELVYTDLEGHKVPLADLKKTDRPMVVEVFGSWCPNCHDAAVHLAELQKEYEKAGLVVVGLAFELTDDAERSIRQVNRFRELHEIKYPLLIAGKADKATAAERIPMIDKVRSYPTTIFIDAKGEVRAVYTGYSGPATGQAHERLRMEFNRVVREMLDEVIK